MSRGLSFRASTTLIVTAYAVILAVLVLGLGQNLARPVPDLVPQVSWLMSETASVRLAALRAAGRPETAALYALASALSWATIVALCAGGFAWGVLNKGATVLGVDRALNYLTAIAGLYALSTCTEILLHLTRIGTPQGGLHAVPAFWFAAMIPSAAILARVGAMISHDAGALVAIAIAAEPARMAELVAVAEERRGVQSLEARLARRIAAMRAAA